MKKLIYIFTLGITCLLISCDRIKNKGQELANKAENKIENEANEAVDKLAPRFDAYEADTKYNKQRFKEFIQVELSPDVQKIYCFDDAIGIDADYQFSFVCDTATVSRIIKKHKLKLDKETTDYAFGFQNDFDWWKKEKIKDLDLYSWNDNNQYFKYFWYDKAEGKVYYFDFDM